MKTRAFVKSNDWIAAQRAGLVRITVRAGCEFRGRQHFESADYDVSVGFARQLALDGTAEFKDPDFARLAKDRELVESIGDRFAADLKEAIGAGSYGEVRRRNARERSAGVCHSHDFCDANEVMFGALVAHGLGAQFDPADDGHCSLWNAAWDYAAVEHLGRKS